MDTAFGNVRRRQRIDAEQEAAPQAADADPTVGTDCKEQEAHSSADDGCHNFIASRSDFSLLARFAAALKLQLFTTTKTQVDFIF